LRMAVEDLSASGIEIFNRFDHVSRERHRQS
jgi:hypothetical protein